jgi:hypothetical protein
VQAETVEEDHHDAVDAVSRDRDTRRERRAEGDVEDVADGAGDTRGAVRLVVRVDHVRGTGVTEAAFEGAHVSYSYFE